MRDHEPTRAHPAGSQGREHLDNGVSTDRLLQVLSTEHFVLQGARSAATAEATSRSSLYLTVVSAAVLALSFVAQANASGLRVLFALLVLPVVFLLGVMSYQRVLQNGIEDFHYVRGLNRIRHAYIQVVPESARYFVLSPYDDAAGVMRSMALVQPARRVSLFTTANMISMITSIVGGVAVAVAGRGPGHAPLAIAVLLGGLAAVAFGGLFYVHQQRRWSRAQDYPPALFPSTDADP
jgi:uncharacterized membrane protein